MTTNHLERLDPALIREGRVDFKAEIGYANKEQLLTLFRRFFPNANPISPSSTLSKEDRDENPAYLVARTFANKVWSIREDRLNRGLKADLSMASVQGYLLRHKHEPFTAIDLAHTIFDPFDQEEVSLSNVTEQATLPNKSQPPKPTVIIAKPDPPVDPDVLRQLYEKFK
jgi:SpoVK/Ycf46/Vps4 family AAA+-type ATPase